MPDNDATLPGNEGLFSYRRFWSGFRGGSGSSSEVSQQEDAPRERERIHMDNEVVRRFALERDLDRVRIRQAAERAYRERREQGEREYEFTQIRGSVPDIPIQGPDTITRPLEAERTLHRRLLREFSELEMDSLRRATQNFDVAANMAQAKPPKSPSPLMPLVRSLEEVLLDDTLNPEASRKVEAVLIDLRNHVNGR